MKLNVFPDHMVSEVGALADWGWGGGCKGIFFSLSVADYLLDWMSF